MKKITISMVASVSLLFAISPSEENLTAVQYGTIKQHDFKRYTNVNTLFPVIAFAHDENSTAQMPFWQFDSNGTLYTENNHSMPLILNTEPLYVETTLEYGKHLYISSLQTPPYEDLFTQIDVLLAVPSTVISRSRSSIELELKPRITHFKKLTMQSSCSVNGWRASLDDVRSEVTFTSGHKALLLRCQVWLHHTQFNGAKKTLEQALAGKKLDISVGGYIYPPIADGKRYKLSLDSLQKYYYKQ